jgi:hypothetical protein
VALGREDFEPFIGVESFRETGRASRSRAAQLLLIAEQLSRPLDAERPASVAIEAEFIDAPAIFAGVDDSLLETWRTAAVFSNRRREYRSEAASHLWNAVRDDSDPQAAVGMSTAYELRDRGGHRAPGARWLNELLGARLTGLEPAIPARSAARLLREASVDGRGAAPRWRRGSRSRCDSLPHTMALTCSSVSLPSVSG